MSPCTLLNIANTWWMLTVGKILLPGEKIYHKFIIWFSCKTWLRNDKNFNIILNYISNIYFWELYTTVLSCQYFSGLINSERCGWDRRCSTESHWCPTCSKNLKMGKEFRRGPYWWMGSDLSRWCSRLTWFNAVLAASC